MAEWTVGKEFEYESCPTTARIKGHCHNSGEEVRIEGEEIVVEKQGVGGCYCCSSTESTVYIPIAVMVEFMEANGYKVTKI